MMISGLSSLIRTFVAGLILISFASFANAVQPDEILDDPVMEERARDISAGLRCMVCQNQSIDDSDAALAKDLRVLVRERLVAGDSNNEVVDFVVERYGEYVLLRPRITAQTYILWASPFIAVALGLAALFVFARKRKGSTVAVSGLSKEEQKALDRILEERDQG